MLKPIVNLKYNALNQPIANNPVANYSLQNYTWGLDFSSTHITQKRTCSRATRQVETPGYESRFG